MDPARMFKESLTSHPELENSQGHVWTAPWQELSDVLQHWSGTREPQRITLWANA